mgnify:CR=1 FL=1
MALFGSFNNLVSTGLSILGQQGGLLGTAGNIGAQIIRASAPAAGSLVASGPTISMAGMASMPMMPQAIQAAAAGVQRILIQVATTLGLRTLTLKRAIRIYRKLARTIVDPFVIAQIMGLTVGQLGELLVADAQRPRRRMNPANSTALRRAARRIESFHKLCQRTDKLRAPRRRSPARGSRTVVKCA